MKVRLFSAVRRRFMVKEKSRPLFRRKLSRLDIQEKPYVAWNSFIDLIAMTPRESLSPAQQVAAFSFKYDAEVQNGGHLQFFENSSGKYVPETREALPQLGAHQQREVLLQAYKRRTSKPRKRIRTVEEYVETGLEQEFEDLDSAYYNCKPTITDLLEKWLDQNFDEFIEIVE